MKQLLVLSLMFIVIFSGCIFGESVRIPTSVCQKMDSNTVYVLLQNNSESVEIREKIQSLDQNYPTINFNYINIGQKTGIDKFDALELLSKGQPAVIIGCDAFIGLKTLDTYKKALDNLKK